MQKTLLQIDLTGSCPNISTLATANGYNVTRATSMRKALSIIKSLKPDVILAEFVFAPTYGSQLSNFESLFGIIETACAESKLIALVHNDDLQHLNKIQTTRAFTIVSLPVDLAALNKAIH